MCRQSIGLYTWRSITHTHTHTHIHTYTHTYRHIYTLPLQPSLKLQHHSISVYHFTILSPTNTIWTQYEGLFTSDTRPQLNLHLTHICTYNDTITGAYSSPIARLYNAILKQNRHIFTRSCLCVAYQENISTIDGATSQSDRWQHWLKVRW